MKKIISDIHFLYNSDSRKPDGRYIEIDNQLLKKLPDGNRGNKIIIYPIKRIIDGAERLFKFKVLELILNKFINKHIRCT